MKEAACRAEVLQLRNEEDKAMLMERMLRAHMCHSRVRVTHVEPGVIGETISN